MKRGTLARFCTLAICCLTLWVMGCGSNTPSPTPTPPGTTQTPTPTISSVTPATFQANPSAAVQITITGTGFLTSSQVQVNGANVSTTYVSATQLTAQIPAAMVTSGTQLAITVLNGTTSSGSSTAASTITITNPVPTIVSLSPATALVGTGPTTVTLTGTGFIPATTLTVNGASHPLTYISSTAVSTLLTTADLGTTGALNLITTNASPGGGSSAAISFSVVNPVPAVNSLSPASVTAGGGAFSLDVGGAGFQLSSVVTWNGAALSTTYVSAGELKAQVPAALIASGGSAQISVTTPAPGGGSATNSAFVIAAAAPVLADIAPHTVTQNQAATITLSGTGFTSNSVAQWNGADRATTFVNATTLQVALSAADLATGGTGQLRVITPAPGGGASASLPLNITNLPIPQITQVSVSVVTQGGCSQLRFTMTGKQFYPGSSTAQINGTTVQTFGSSTVQIGTLPTGFAAAGDVTFTLTSTLFSNDVSEPFVLHGAASPLLAFCSLPSNPSIYPGSSFLSTISASSIGLGGKPSITNLTLPSGVTTAATVPFSVESTGTRLLFQAGSTLSAGALTIPFTGTQGAISANGAVAFTVSSAAPPSFFFPTPLIRELAIPLGGSGSITLSSSVNSTYSTDYAVSLSISGLPPGTNATVTPSTIIPGESFTIKVTADTNAPITQNTNVTVTGTPSVAVPAQSVSFLLDVTQKPGSLPNNRSDFVSTAGTPYAAAYSRSQDLIYASNPAWNRIDILSNKDRKLLQSISVRGPRAIDLSADEKTLWIGTNSQQIFALDTAALTLTRYLAPPLTGIYSNQAAPITWLDDKLYALADGSLFLTVEPYQGSGSNFNLIWNPVQNTVRNLATTYYFSLRSGDRTKVYGITQNSVSCQVVVYDTTAQQVAPLPSLNEVCGFAAVNYDGSRFVAEDSGHFGLYNASLQLIATLPSSIITADIYPQVGWLFSPDGATLYGFGGNSGLYAITIDVPSLTLKGTAPAFFFSASDTSLITRPAPFAVDSAGILLGVQGFGIGWNDSTFFQTYPATPIGQNYPVSITPRAGPLSGGTPSVPYGFYALTPDVWYGANRGTGSVDATNTLTITSPKGDLPGPVNLKLLYPDGAETFLPQAFSYSTYPQYAVLSGASPNGGVPGRIAGYGMPADSSGGSVTIGGIPAAITTQVTQYPPYTSEPFPSTYLDFTIPAGLPGYADLQVTTPIGTGTLPKAIFYAKSVTDYSSPDSFTDVLYDDTRKQVYLAAGDHIDVFSLSSKQFTTPLRPVSLGAVSSFRGLALTPDGSQLLAANMPDGSLGVINPDAPAQTFAIPIAAATGTGTSCATGPFAVAALAGNRAFVSFGLPPQVGGCPAFNLLYTANLQTRSAALVNSSCATAYGNPPSALESTTDGSLAVIGTHGAGTCFFNALSGTFAPGAGAISYYGATLAGDGNIAAVGNQFSDAGGHALGEVGRPAPLYGAPSLYPTNNYPSGTLQRPRLNGSGSLYFWAFPKYFEIVDVPTGTLRLRFSLSETIQNVETPLAIDAVGQLAFLITDAGLTVVDLGIAPLSVGHLSLTTAPAGTQVTVRGSGFVAGLTAKLGETPAQATVIDASTLVLTVPNTPGLKNLSLTKPDGTAYVLPSALLVQ